MKTDDKRKETSRLNALKSTGPKTPEGKLRSSFNAVTHAAYVQELILPGEELPQFQLILDAHHDNWNPTNPIEETFVFEMASTLWRLRRQAPAESALIGIQIQRMSREIIRDFATASPSAIYALAVVALQEHGDALNQISRQGRRLLSQYEKLTQQLLNMRQLFPPVAPEAPDFAPHPEFDVQNEPVETKLTEDQESPSQSTGNETVETPVETKLTEDQESPSQSTGNETVESPVETKLTEDQEFPNQSTGNETVGTPVETKLTEDQESPNQSTGNETVEIPVGTKLIGSVAPHLLSCEAPVHSPHSILYAALPLFSQLANPTPNTAIEAPAKVNSAVS